MGPPQSHQNNFMLRHYATKLPAYCLFLLSFACQVEKGATAAVFGLGTIGLAVIDALREVGAKMIIGVDMDEGKFERAKTWGATDLLNPSKLDGSVVVSILALLQH